MPDKKIHKENSRKSILLFLLGAVLAAVTILISWKYGSRRYYLTSVLLLVYACLPFFGLFEKRRPKAKEIVLIAVMTALTSVSRILFIWLPNVKPMYAMIMLSGMFLGPESGYMIGALSAFVSNFVFEQGPWTPWQMAAAGLAGVIPALFYRHGFLKHRKLPVSIFGACFYLLIVGPLLDTCSYFLMMGTDLQAGYAASVYLAGLPVNITQAIATGVFLFLLYQPIGEKLQRVVIKYGLFEEAE